MEIFNSETPKRRKRIGRAPKYKLEYYMMMAKQVVDHGMSFREAARIYKMSHGSVSHWKKVYLSGRFPAMLKKEEVSPDHKLLQLETHVRNLKQEIADLYLENTMLKKMIKYSRRAKKEESSVITPENLVQFQKRVK